MGSDAATRREMGLWLKRPTGACFGLQIELVTMGQYLKSPSLRKSREEGGDYVSSLSEDSDLRLREEFSA